jgi:hypothetical protein
MERKPYTLDLPSITSARLRCGYPIIHPHRASRTRCGGFSTTACILPDAPLLHSDTNLACLPSKARPDPRDNGSDLIGCAFFEPELGVCIISGLVLSSNQNQMSTRARRRRNLSFNEPLLPTGTHFTLMYQQTTTGEEHYSSLTEILYWIDTGPLLQPPLDPVSVNQTDAPITTPFDVPATVQHVPNSQPAVITAPNATPAPIPPAITPWVRNRRGKRVSLPRPNSPDETPERQRVPEQPQPQQTVPHVADWTGTNGSERTQKRKNVPKVSGWTEKGCPFPGKPKPWLPTT